jgi:hypothetical protein
MLAVNSAHGRRSAFEAVKGLDPRRRMIPASIKLALQMYLLKYHQS